MRRALSFWLSACGWEWPFRWPSAQAPYAPPRTPWGDPDLQAIWSGDSAFGIPLQRPTALGTKGELTDAEFAEKVKRDQRTRTTAENAVGSFRNDNSWLTRSFRQTSLIVDPPDGRAPALVPGAEARRTPQGTYGNGPLNGPEDFTLYDRCITLGVVGSMTPKIYGNGYRIVQAPGYAVIMAEMIHEARVIPLDGRPHVGAGVRGYLGRFARPLGRQHAGDRDHELQRQGDRAGQSRAGEHRAEDHRTHHARRAGTAALRSDGDRSRRPTRSRSRSRSPSRRLAGYQVLPYECHEGNLAVLQGLGGERAEDRALEEDRKKGIIRPRRPIQGGLTVGGQPIPESGPPASPTLKA